MNINEYFESLPESEEIIRKQALEKLKKAFYKMHLNSRYGAGTYMIVSAQTKEMIDNIQKTNFENERYIFENLPEDEFEVALARILLRADKVGDKAYEEQMRKLLINMKLALDSSRHIEGIDVEID